MFIICGAGCFTLLTCFDLIVYYLFMLGWCFGGLLHCIGLLFMFVGSVITLLIVVFDMMLFISTMFGLIRWFWVFVWWFSCLCVCYCLFVFRICCGSCVWCWVALLVWFCYLIIWFCVWLLLGVCYIDC